MTRVDFYILPHDDGTQRNLFACRLVEKAYTLGHSVYLHTSSAEQATQLDQMLWSFSSESFIPHSQDNGENAAQKDLVKIGHTDDPGEHHDVLINLALTIPEFFSRFERVSEVVCQQQDILDASRHNWKFYQDRGYPLQSHKIKA